MLESFFIYGTLPSGVEKGYYQLPLVLLSYAVASFASYTALSLAQQLVGARTFWERRLFHWGGAFAMGAGIWSMHFVGMLSYRMRMVVEYEPLLTLLSMLIAIAVAYGALGIVARARLSAWQIMTGAVLLGLGICGMHYTGMAAMKMDGDLRYMPGTFFLSVVIAIAASGAALWMAFTLARHDTPYRYLFQIGAALIMGAAICGMHYTGMASSVFIPFAQCRYDPNQNFDILALSIAAITSIILGIALSVGIYRKTQAEFQLQSSEQRMRAMIDNALDAVIAMDQEGKITEWNKQAEVIFGWSYQEAIGKFLAELIIPPEYREAHSQGMQRFLKGGAGPILNRRIEVSALNRRNEQFPVELTVTAQKQHGTYHFTAFLRDITDRKQAEKTRGLLASIVASSDDPIISTTLDGVITSWNAAAEALFGYSAAEAIDHPISLIIPEGRKAEERAIIRELLAGRPIKRFETIRVAKNEQRINISLTVSPIRDAAGQIIGASKITHDITERKRTEAQLQATLEEITAAKRLAEEAQAKAEVANRAKSEFLANMSHEIRTPLNSIIGTSELLANTSLSSEQSEYAETINTAGDILLSLINNILDYSKIESGEFEILTLPIMVRTLLEEVVQVIAGRAKTNSIALSVVCQDEVPMTVLGDPIRLKQILLNLTGNAVKFCTHGKVVIRVEALNKDGDKIALRFSVEDTGRGIPADKLKIIFEKFTQLDQFATKKYAGTGLGLAISKRLVEMMGGTIGVESTVGKGSRFWFDLPFVLDTVKDASDTAMRVLLQDKHALLIDSFAYNRRSMLEYLSLIGIHCDIVTSVQEALLKLQAHKHYDLVFIDDSISEANPQKIVLTLQLLRAMGDPRLVLMTSFTPEAIPDVFRNAGFAACVPKPVNLSTLFNAIANVLGSARPAQAAKPALTPKDYHGKITQQFRGRILLVEDYPPNQQMAKKILEKMGCEVEVAGNGEEALECMAKSMYDVVFMDCQMPEMDGFQTTAEIRKREGKVHTVIVAMTANALSGDRERCMQTGMDDYISKPIRSAELGQILGKYLAA